MSGAERTVGDVIVERLREWNVPRVYGYSGDGVNGLLEAIRRSDGAIGFVQARHEENAAFMAVGEAKYHGGVGVVLSTQGPGAVHLLNGLYDAKLDHVPVVALVGQQHRSVLGSGYMQEIDLPALFADVAAQYVALVSTPEQVPMVIDRAFRTALATSSPDGRDRAPRRAVGARARAAPRARGGGHRAGLRARGAHASSRSGAEAAALLNSAERPVMLVGRGAAAARGEVIAVAERFGAAIVTSLLGKPFVDERHPVVAGTMGHLGTTASAKVLAECDALLIVGSHDPWTEYYPAPGQARAVQIDIDARVIGDRYPIEVGLVGDCRRHPAAHRRADRASRRHRMDVARCGCARRSDWHRVRDARAVVAADQVNPEAAMRALDSHLPDDRRVALDVGSVVYWYARQLYLPEGMVPHVSGTLASMGCGVAVRDRGEARSIRSSGRRPDRRRRHADERARRTRDGRLPLAGWPDPRFVVAVFDNRDLAEVSWEQREVEGAPRFAASQALPDVPYAEYARLLGLAGERVDEPGDLDAAWSARSRPTGRTCSMRTDAAVPLLPPLAAGTEHARRDARVPARPSDARAARRPIGPGACSTSTSRSSSAASRRSSDSAHAAVIARQSSSIQFGIVSSTSDATADPAGVPWSRAVRSSIARTRSSSSSSSSSVCMDSVTSWLAGPTSMFADARSPWSS